MQLVLLNQAIYAIFRGLYGSTEASKVLATILASGAVKNVGVVH